MPFAANIDDLVLADAETDPHSLPPLVAPFGTQVVGDLGNK
jgi:hypothetical protein